MSRRSISVSLPAYNRLALYCDAHGVSMSGVVETLLEVLPEPTMTALLELERLGRVERCGVNAAGEQLWRAKV